MYLTTFQSICGWYSLIGKQSPQVTAELQKLFYMFGLDPKKLRSDIGGEFQNKHMENLCQTHKIKFVHGAPRNPSAQSQVERNNSTIKARGKCKFLTRLQTYSTSFLWEGGLGLGQTNIEHQ